MQLIVPCYLKSFCQCWKDRTSLTMWPPLEIPCLKTLWTGSQYRTKPWHRYPAYLPTAYVELYEFLDFSFCKEKGEMFTCKLSWWSLVTIMMQSWFVNRCLHSQLTSCFNVYGLPRARKHAAYHCLTILK